MAPQHRPGAAGTWARLCGRIPGHTKADCPGRRQGPGDPRWEVPTSEQTHSLCRRPGLQRAGLHTPRRGVSACLSLAAHPWDCPCPSLSPCRQVWQHQGQRRAGLCPVDRLRVKVLPWAPGSVEPRVRDRHPQPVQPGSGGQAAPAPGPGALLPEGARLDPVHPPSRGPTAQRVALRLHLPQRRRPTPAKQGCCPLEGGDEGPGESHHKRQRRAAGRPGVSVRTPARAPPPSPPLVQSARWSTYLTGSHRIFWFYYHQSQGQPLLSNKRHALNSLSLTSNLNLDTGLVGDP